MIDGSISAGQREALQNLSRKQQGQDVGFINIAHARALTELQLAVRSPQGWRITPEGISLLKRTQD